MCVDVVDVELAIKVVNFVAEVGRAVLISGNSK